eukprot:s1325_g4.t1
MHQYKNLQPQQAEVAKDMHKLGRLLETLLAVSPTGQIKYAALKQALGCLSQKFGSDLLAAHFEGEKSLLAGRAADSITVLLKNWRRATASAQSWEKFESRLDEAQAMVIGGLGKQMTLPSKEEKPRKKRALKKEESEVTMGPDGYHLTLKLGQKLPALEMVVQSHVCKRSPPPVLKADWKKAAGKEVKKNSC